MQDLLNALCGAGLTLRRMEEMFDEEDRGHFFFYEEERAKLSREQIGAWYDWRKNPLAALPAWRAVRAVKYGEGQGE